jgi:hypothetical protein
MQDKLTSSALVLTLGLRSNEIERARHFVSFETRARISRSSDDLTDHLIERTRMSSFMVALHLEFIIYR